MKLNPNFPWRPRQNPESRANLNSNSIVYRLKINSLDLPVLGGIGTAVSKYSLKNGRELCATSNENFV